MMPQKGKQKLSQFAMNLARSVGGYQEPKPKAARVPKRGFIYLLRTPHDATLYKIGKATDPKNRLRTFNVKLPFPVEFDCLIETTDMSLLEKWLHDRYADKRIGGEWFRLTLNDVDDIKALANGVKQEI